MRGANATCMRPGRILKLSTVKESSGLRKFGQLSSTIWENGLKRLKHSSQRSYEPTYVVRPPIISMAE